MAEATKSTTEKKVLPFPVNAKTMKESEKKWGKKVMSHGFCIFPSMLLQAQARLKISAQEMMVLLHLTEHWWLSTSKVFPSKQTVGNRIGLSEKQVQRHVVQLEKMKLVKRIPRFLPGRGRTTNEYDLSGLVERLKEIELEVAKAKKIAAGTKQAGGLVAALKDFK